MDAARNYAPNVSWLFPELPFAERLASVSALGFRAIEFGFPSQADIEALAAAQRHDGLTIVLFNQDVPVWDGANRGYLVDPARRHEFDRQLDRALDIAERLHVAKIMLPAGVRLPALARQAQVDCLLANLALAAPRAASAGVLLTLEMLNPADNPGYFLDSTSETLDLVKQVNHPNIRFQFDSYHVQRMEGDPVERLAGIGPWLGHVQFADEPGRHEPGTGRIDFNRLTRWLADEGYHDWIGLEYLPQQPGAAALAWCLPATPASDPTNIQANATRRQE
jgi:hydroxypyruvate isomerase